MLKKTLRISMKRTNNTVKKMFEGKAKLQKELEEASFYIDELEAKLLKAHESAVDLLKALKSAEFEIEHLK